VKKAVRKKRPEMIRLEVFMDREALEENIESKAKKEGAAGACDIFAAVIASPDFACRRLKGGAK
jgi:hypothetical protein